MAVDLAAIPCSADVATDQVLQPGGRRARTPLGTEIAESLSLARERYPGKLQVYTQSPVGIQDSRDISLMQC